MTVTTETFEQLAPRVIRQLRGALSAVIEASGGSAPIRKATDLERELDLPTTLAWKVFTVAQANAPLSKVSNIPGPGAMTRFFEAARRKGVPTDLLDAARSAFAEFEGLVRHHAGTRLALDSMISSLESNGCDQIDLHHKRAAFQAQSHIWGVQAQTQLSCFVLRASRDDPAHLDAIGLRGFHNLWLRRRDVSWVISTARVSDDDGKIRRPVHMKPLDEVESSDDAPVSLIRRFCSTPLPKFRNVQGQGGFVNTVIEPDSIGSQSAMTCLLGDILPKASARYRDEHNRVHGSVSYIRTPSEVLIHDVLVEPGTFASGEPWLKILGDHRCIDPAISGRDSDRLALNESVTYLGRGVSVLHTPDLPRYPDVVQYALDKAGWSGSELDVYRCRMEFPVMPSSVIVEFRLLNHPD